jgi:PPP family 3-phenylpropionic acid transporter
MRSKPTAAFYAAYFAVLGVVLPFLGPYLETRGVSAVGIGIITAAFSLAKLVYSPMIASAVDRGFWFRGMLTVHLAISIGSLLMVMSSSNRLEFLAFSFFVVGLGYGTVLPLVEAAVLEDLPRRSYGLLRLWGSVGFVAAATVAMPLASRNLITGFPVLVAAALVVLWLTCLPFERTARPQRQQSHGRIPPAVWGMLALLTLHQVSHGPYYAFFSVHLGSEGFSNLTVGLMWSIGVASELLAFLSGPLLERLLGLRLLLTLALVFSPLRWLLLSLEPSTPLLVVAQAGHAVTFALVHLAGVQLVQLNVPEGARRHAQALYSGLSFGLGIVVGSALAGPLYASFGGRGSFFTASAFSVALCLAWLPLARRLGKE